MIGPETVAALSRTSQSLLVVGSEMTAPSELILNGSRSEVEKSLAGMGFLCAGEIWARATGAEVEALRLRSHEHRAELLSKADTHKGGWLAPAAEHRILLAAERLVTDLHVETSCVAAEARAALAADPEAWRLALKRGLDRGLWRGLAHLERAMGGAVTTEADRREARIELRRTRAELATWPSPAAALVAVSGVDGAGKSLQCRALQVGLTAAGVPAAIEWTRVAADRRLDQIARPVVALVSRLRHDKRTAPTPAGTGSSDNPRAARALRERNRLVGTVWAYVVAVLAVSAQRRSTRLHRGQGRAVIRDRYLLDAVVQLRDDYGVRCGRFARLQLRWLASRPDAAFLLLVSPEAALARKQEQYDLADLRRLAAGYRQAAAELGVRVIDGERSPDEISEELFAAVWARLAQMSGPRR